MAVVRLEGQPIHSNRRTLTTLSAVKLANPEVEVLRESAQKPTLVVNGNESFLGIRFYLEQRRGSGDGGGVNCEPAHARELAHRDTEMFYCMYLPW